MAKASRFSEPASGATSQRLVEPESPSAGVQSFETGLQLLSLLAELDDGSAPPMLKSIAAAAQMSSAKVHRYMVSLIRTGHAERDPRTGRYRLGPAARQLGITALRHMNVVRQGAQRLPQWAGELRQSMALAIWTVNGPVVVATEDLRQPVTVGTRVGETLPLLRSATGRVFAAWMPTHATQDLIRRELALAARAIEGDEPSNKRELEDLLTRIRAAGLAWTEGGLNPTVSALAAPVFDFRGGLVAALACLGQTGSIDLRRSGTLARSLRDAARTLSMELGAAP